MFFQNVVKTEQSLFTFRISAALTRGRIATAGNGKQFDPSIVSPPPASKDSHNSCSFPPSCFGGVFFFWGGGSSCNEFARNPAPVGIRFNFTDPFGSNIRLKEYGNATRHNREANTLVQEEEQEVNKILYLMSVHLLNDLFLLLVSHLLYRYTKFVLFV